MYDIHRASERLKNFESELFQDIYHKQKTLQNPIDLSVGLPEGPTPQYIKDAGIRAIQEGHTVYTPSNGISELRDAIAEKLRRENNIDVTKDEISILPGLTTGFLLIYLALIDPGDEIMLMEPCYPSYHYLGPLADGVLKWVPTLDNFQLDLDAIEAAITPKTRLIIINTPNNPTGAVYPKEDLIRLAEIAGKHDILILSDEMYESFLYEGEHFSIGSIYPNTLTMNGFSKTYSMTGWRLGYVAGPAKIISAINQIQQYAVFSSSSIAQYAALEALSRPAPDRSNYRQKRELVNRKLREAGIELHGNDGAYYAFFKAPAGMTDIEFVNKAAEHNLLLLPGRAFSTKDTYIRLSYGGTIENVEKGLDIITEITRQAQK